MSNKKLTMLGIIAAVMLVLALLVAQSTKVTPTPSLAGTVLMQGLDPGAIVKIVLGSGEKESVLKRQGERFAAADKANYPASNKEINSLLAKCLDIKISQKITDNAANYEDLQVTEDSARYVVRFYDGNDELMTGVIIGKTAEGIRGTYVRKIGEDVVYLSENTPYLPMTSLDYVDKNLTQVDTAKITEVSVSTPSDSYTIVTKDGKPSLKAMEAGATAKDQEIRRVYDALSSLMFDDVMPASEAEDLTFNYQYVCKLDDSTVYTLKLAKKGEDFYVKAMTDFTDTAPVTVDRRGEDDEAMKAKEAKLMARDASKAFNETHGGWVYKLSSWQAGKLTKAYGDLVEAPVEEETSAGDAQATEEAVETQP